LPRTSPAIRILTVFGSDISPVSLRWPGARELWWCVRGSNDRHLQKKLINGK
jgi:hypothetical protein